MSYAEGTHSAEHYPSCSQTTSVYFAADGRSHAVAFGSPLGVICGPRVASSPCLPARNTIFRRTNAPTALCVGRQCKQRACVQHPLHCYSSCNCLHSHLHIERASELVHSIFHLHWRLRLLGALCIYKWTRGVILQSAAGAGALLQQLFKHVACARFH
jgi:hypothetical protein